MKMLSPAIFFFWGGGGGGQTRKKHAPRSKSFEKTQKTVFSELLDSVDISAKLKSVKCIT